MCKIHGLIDFTKSSFSWKDLLEILEIMDSIKNDERNHCIEFVGGNL